jgi:integrase
MAKTTELLSVLKIKNLTAPGRHSDGGGLYLVVRPGTSTKSWTFLFRDPFTRDKWGNGKPTECGLGSYPFVTAKQARAKAAEGRELLSENPPRNPKAVWAEQRRLGSIPTFAEMADEVIDLKATKWRSARHREQLQAALRKQCGPIADVRVDQIGTEDVLRVIQAYAKRAPSSALKLRGTIEQVLASAKARGFIDRHATNPAVWRDHLDQLLPSAPAPKHHAAMPYSELPAFVGRLRAARRDVEGRINVAAYALEFLILTAGRSGEVRLAEWTEIDLVAKRWTIPPERMKAGKPYTVPLTDGMLEILEAMRPLCRSDLIFPGTKPGQPLTGKSYERLLARLGAKCVAHGFRSSFRDWAGNETHADRETCEMALAHAVGNAVEQAYRRSHPLEKHRALLELWDRYLSPRTDNVVSLRMA